MQTRTPSQPAFGRPLSLADAKRDDQSRLSTAGANAAIAILVLLIATAPIPFGSVLPSGHFLIQSLSFAAAAAAFASRPKGRGIGAAAISVGAMIGVAVVGLIQLIPMSSSGLTTIAPVSAQTYRDVNEILGLYGRAALSPKVSISPMSTTTTVLLTLAYAAAFTAAAIVCTTRTRRRILIGALLMCSAIHIVVAAATYDPTLRMHGAFVNANHLAGYLQIALASAFAVVWLELLRSADRAAGVTDIGARLEKRAVPLILRVLLWGVIAAGIALTRSRGGMFAGFVAGVIVLITASLQRLSRGHRVALAPVAAVIGGAIFAFLTVGDAPLLRILGSDPRDVTTDTRVRIWSASIDAFHRSPLLGTGLGTFRDAFRRVQPAEIQGLVEQAHNDFLQMLVTGGGIGAAVTVFALGSLLYLLMMRWWRLQRREENAIALAGIGALIALILHGFVEFNMSIPAIPATLAVILGVAWSAANDGVRSSAAQPQEIARTSPEAASTLPQSSAHRR